MFVLINLINRELHEADAGNRRPASIVFVAAAFMVMAGYYTMMKIADIDI